MKASTALHIAEHLWEDTVKSGSMFDQLMKLGPEMNELMTKGDFKKLDEKVGEVRSEIVARWANVIMEVEGHTGEQNRIH